MNIIIKSVLCALPLSIWTHGVGQTVATPHVRITPDAPPFNKTPILVRLKGIVASLDATKLRPPAPATREPLLVDLGKRSASRLLHLGFSDLPAEVYTLQTKDGDVLIARWRGATAGFLNTTVWLYDDPLFTNLVFELSPDRLRPNELTLFSEQLFNWNETRGHLQSMALYYQGITPGAERVEGRPTHNNFTRALWPGALSLNGKAYFGILMSKVIFSPAYPPDVDEVAERFPPLRSRLANLSRQDLFQEIGRGFRSPDVDFNRDSIVMEEIVSRGLV